jgi:perosamine synthetase
LQVTRTEIFVALRAKGIGVNVHYIPVHLHPYYQKQLGCKKGLCPVAEEAYEQILSLPIYPAMTDDDVGKVVTAVRGTLYK